MELFKVTFKRRIMFGLGERMTTQKYSATFNIHIKTTLKPVGAEKHGYPDDTYFSRTLDALKENSITLADVA